MCGSDVAGDVDTWPVCRTCCHQTCVAQVAQAVPLQTVDAVCARAVEGVHGGVLTRPSGELRLNLWVVIQNRDNLICRVGGRGCATAQVLGDRRRKKVFEELALGAQDVA